MSSSKIEKEGKPTSHALAKVGVDQSFGQTHTWRILHVLIKKGECRPAIRSNSQLVYFTCSYKNGSSARGATPATTLTMGRWAPPPARPLHVLPLSNVRSENRRGSLSAPVQTQYSPGQAFYITEKIGRHPTLFTLALIRGYAINKPKQNITEGKKVTQNPNPLLYVKYG